MKYSVEQEILLQPLGMETGYPAETVDGNTFYLYDLGNNHGFVWRTLDRELEVGRVGAVYYGKVMFRLLEGIYATPRSAMRRCVEIRAMIESGQVATPPLITPHG